MKDQTFGIEIEMNHISRARGRRGRRGTLWNPRRVRRWNL